MLTTIVVPVVVKGFSGVVSSNVPALCLLIGGLLFSFYRLVLFPLWLSPYRDIPGPYIHRVLGIPALWFQVQNQWVRRVHSLHQQYGDVVLISPSLVSFNGRLDLVHDVYVRNMPKLEYYKLFRAHGHDNLFLTISSAEHLRHRRLLHKLYLKTSVWGLEVTRQILTLQMGKMGQRLALLLLENIAADVYSLFGALAMDCITAFELGAQSGTDLMTNTRLREVLSAHRKENDTLSFLSSLPPPISWVCRKLRRLATTSATEAWLFNLYPKSFFVHQKSRTPMHRVENVADIEKGANIPRFQETLVDTSLHRLLSAGYLPLQACAFVSDNIVAGHETTALALTYLTYELSRPVNMHHQSRLRFELEREFGPWSAEKPPISNVSGVMRLPYLDALVTENFRVHTLGIGAMPRVVPAPYEILFSGKSVVLPTGTEISCQQFLMHRTELVFPNPDTWMPERWFQSKSQVNHMRKHIMLFGRGVRMCLGMNLALAEFKLAIANIYWQYESEVCSQWCSVTQNKPGRPVKPISLVSGPQDGSDEDKMGMLDSSSTRPCCDECRLRFRRIQTL